MPKGRGYKSPHNSPAPKIPKEGGDSASVTGNDAAGFGGGKRYSVNQTKGTENKAPTSGGGK